MTAKGLRITTIESCTGGALTNTITDIPGASEILKDAFVTYSNESKIAMGVPEKTLQDYTVYSPQTAEVMAEAGLRRSIAKPDISVGITGSLSRTDPDNPDASVVGEVYIAIIHPAGRSELALNVPASLSRPEAKQLIVRQTLQKLLEIIK